MSKTIALPNSFASMVLLTSYYGPGQKTFKMMPISNDAPFIECIFNNDHNVLAVIGKDKKQSLQMVPKLNDNGEQDLVKQTGHAKKHRITLETYYEYYITEADEIIEFVNAFAINAEKFDYQKFFRVEESTTGEGQADLKEAA